MLNHDDHPMFADHGWNNLFARKMHPNRDSNPCMKFAIGTAKTVRMSDHQYNTDLLMLLVTCISHLAPVIGKCCSFLLELDSWQPEICNVFNLSCEMVRIRSTSSIQNLFHLHNARNFVFYTHAHTYKFIVLPSSVPQLIKPAVSAVSRHSYIKRYPHHLHRVLNCLVR